jgi:uncharacterized membrane protein YqiK
VIFNGELIERLVEIKFENMMGIIVVLGFVGIVVFFAYRRFKKANEGKDCCK